MGDVCGMKCDEETKSVSGVCLPVSLTLHCYV